MKKIETKQILSFGGINLHQIENWDLISHYIESSKCPVCLKIVRNPVECEKCDTYYCKDCYDSIKILKIKENCNSEPVKANKFIRNILSKLKITCEYCKKQNIEYDNYTKHLIECSKSTNLHSLRDELIKNIKEKQDEINSLEHDLVTSANNKGINEKSFFNQMSDKSIREKILTFKLTPSEKSELYNATIEGNLSKFKSLVIDQKYPMFEEISVKGYLWTPIHYAMHYGKFEIINFIFKESEKLNNLNYIIRCKSDDNRCPLLCLVRSNSIKLNEKNEILEKILQNFPNLFISQEVINESILKKISDSIIKKLKIFHEKYYKNSITNFYPKEKDIYSKLNDGQVREKIMTFNLSSEQKMALYNATISGDVTKLKSLVYDSQYPLFEEISAKGYFWTALHYAMHYGKIDLITFILSYAEGKNVLNLIIRCKSNDNRCPLLCLLKTTSVSTI